MRAWQLKSFRSASRCPLAARAEVAASSSHNRATDQRSAAKALLAFALVNAMPPLKSSAFSF